MRRRASQRYFPDLACKNNLFHHLISQSHIHALNKVTLINAYYFTKAWSSRPNIHWVVPMLSGVLFGLGVDLIFMGLTNYLTDSYDVYSASAMASSIFSRNIAAALLLPLASSKMYEQLGVAWACSILGFACFGMSTIPFAFIRFGPKLREKSKFCQRLKQRKLVGGSVGMDL